MATMLREYPLPAYDTDAAGWSEAQANALRERRVDLLDWENLAEEIADVARREGEKLTSAIRIILMHLLKWDHQPARRSRSWWLSIADKRMQAALRLEDNPSLRPRLASLIDRAYRLARHKAAVEMNARLDTLPADCPYSFDEIMTRPIEWDGEFA